jgi:hypothetical protein
MAGGTSESTTDASVSVALDSAELYDPKTGVFSPTGSMSVQRQSATATLLGDGTVLIAGGNDGNTAIDSAEIYNPATGLFKRTGSMNLARTYQAAPLLGDGHVLVLGGTNLSENLASAELYDPKTGVFLLTGSMAEQRDSSTATPLFNGDVLVVGGTYGPVTSGGRNIPLASAEIYDPASGEFRPTGQMSEARFSQAATRLSDGRVLVTGGTDGLTSLTSAEIYSQGAVR